jgi:metal-responsive CopG/Arc/MetJ family transcriptional regulator
MTRSKRILVALPDDQLAELEAIRTREGSSVSWQIRKAVTQYLEKKKEKK